MFVRVMKKFLADIEPRDSNEHFQKSLLLSHALSQFDPVLSFTPVSLTEVNFNIICFLPARPTFPRVFFFYVRSSDETPVYFLIVHMQFTHVPSRILIAVVTRTRLN